MRKHAALLTQSKHVSGELSIIGVHSVEPCINWLRLLRPRISADRHNSGWLFLKVVVPFWLTQQRQRVDDIGKKPMVGHPRTFPVLKIWSVSCGIRFTGLFGV